MENLQIDTPLEQSGQRFRSQKGVGNELFIILEIENQLIRTVMGGYDCHRGVMNYLAVHPKLQGRGYGKMLVEAIENKLINLGCPKVNLLIRSNHEVSNFYESVQYAK